MNKFDLFEEETAIEEIEITIEAEPTKWEKNGKKSWKNESEKYTENFYIRCTKSEKEEIKKESESFDLSQSRFLVAKALYANRVLSKEETELLAKNLQELSRISINLNQIAFGLNATRLRGEIAELTQKQLFNLAEETKNIVSKSKEMLKKMYGNSNSNNK